MKSLFASVQVHQHKRQSPLVSIMDHWRIIICIVVLLPAFLQGSTENEITDNKTKEQVSAPTAIPDLSTINDIPTKKKLFFDFLKPVVHKENAKIAAKRLRVEHHWQSFQNEGSLPAKQRQWLEELALSYRLNDADFTIAATYPRLLERVDLVPAALALVQAANESAWGTSRFARQGNNLFGQWCFTKDCGIVPSRRDSSASHEVAVFPSVQESVRSYLHNLNTGNAYESLRLIRRDLQDAGKVPDAHSLAVGLEKYSSRGAEYVAELQAMLRVNASYLQ
jgi:Bax protein